MPPARSAKTGSDLTALVERKVAEALEGNSANVLQPFFADRATTTAARRRQTVVEQRKWPSYFRDWGCLVCGTREGRHGSLGMCPPCYARTTQRMKQTLRRANAERPAQYDGGIDLQAIAREAIIPSIEFLETNARTKR